MMQCPQCKTHTSRCEETRDNSDGSILRHRRCEYCGTDFKTQETPIISSIRLRQLHLAQQAKQSEHGLPQNSC